MDYLRERGQNSPSAFAEVEPYYFVFSILINIVGALIYYAPFALVYRAWENRKRDATSAPL